MDTKAKTMFCPNCSAHIQFTVKFEVSDLKKVEITPTETVTKRQSKLQEREEIRKKYADCIDIAKRTGVYEAFNKALDATPQNLPVDREAYFIKWMQKAIKVNTPYYAPLQCLPDDAYEPNAELELWTRQYVSGIVVNKNFKCFIPTPLIKGEVIETLEITPNKIEVKHQTDLPNWVRSKFGYVERGAEFHQELRKHSIGGFSL